MRKKSSFKNLITSFFPYIIVLVLGFVKVDVFLDSLGEEIYALNQLFFQLFAYISLAEAGASGYIVQLYYKHFVTGNKEEIKRIYNGSVRFMKKVSMIVFGLGVIVSFFLKLFTNNSLSLPYMQVVFILFILRSVFEYLLLSPKLVMQADQKLYRTNIIYYICKILELGLEIGLLSLGVDYIVTILSSMIIRVSMYLVINYNVFKEYPWLRDKIETDDIKIKGIKNMFVHRIAEAIHYNTDIILASSYLSPFVVTVYSSYNYITKYLTDGVDIFGNSISASVGNFIYKEKNDEQIRIMNQLLSLYQVFAIFFVSVCFITINSFISLWIGEKYVISLLGLVFLMLNLFIVIARKPMNVYYNSAGWYKETRVIVILEAIVNLVLSLILVNYYGVVGLLLATTCSMLTTTFWFIPKFVIKEKLGGSLVKYYGRYLIALLIAALLSFMGTVIGSKFAINSFFAWVIYAFVTSVVIFVLVVLVYYITNNDFKCIFMKILDIVKIKTRKGGKREKEANS